MLDSTVNKAINEVKSSIKSLNKAVNKDFELCKTYEAELSGLIEIHEFIAEATWVKSSGMRNKIKYYCTYGRKATLRAFNLTSESLTNTLRYGGDLLKKYITAQDIARLRMGYVDAVMLSFHVRIGSISFETLLCGDVSELLKGKKLTSTKLTSCANELNFLHLFSKEHLNKCLEKVNLNNLLLLQFILDTDNPMYEKERTSIVKCLVGEVSGVDADNSLKDSGIYGCDINLQY